MLAMVQIRSPLAPPIAFNLAANEASLVLDCIRHTLKTGHESGVRFPDRDVSYQFHLGPRDYTLRFIGPDVPVKSYAEIRLTREELEALRDEIEKELAK